MKLRNFGEHFRNKRDPGYAGQPFIPEMLAKITQLHQLKETGSLRFLLEVDGSCNRNTYRA